MQKKELENNFEKSEKIAVLNMRSSSVYLTEKMKRRNEEELVEEHGLRERFLKQKESKLDQKTKMRNKVFEISEVYDPDEE